MSSKKPNKGGDERVKSGNSNSPGGRKHEKGATSVASGEGKRQKFVIWSEWSDADINGEKWDGPPKGKDKERGKSPVPQHYFDDPDGKVIMPPSLHVYQWKRPQEVYPDRAPVVVDPDHTFHFDLMEGNEHVLHSETMRWIISQIDALWKVSAVKATGTEPPEIPISPDGTVYQWRPWEHIFAMTKIAKGPNVPQFNPYGKYAVKLFFMGCWRKVFVDDSLPFDENDHLLLPATTVTHELWPMLLTKALIKVASIDYGAGSGNMEIGDFSVIHCLTGWLPQTILINKGQEDKVWKVLKDLLPEWKLPEPEKEPTLDLDDPSRASHQPGTTPEGGDPKEAASSKGKKDDKAKGKDAGKEKKDVGKDKKALGTEDQVVYEKPEVVVFASYYDVTRKKPFSVMSMSRMADHSEMLRREGFSHLYSHPVVLSQIRACPLTPPTPPEVIPAWKTIRPRVKKPFPTSEEPQEEAKVEMATQFVQIESPFVNFRVSPVPIPTNTSRPCSSLQRGGTRPSTPAAPSIEEDPPEDPEITALNAAAAALAQKNKTDDVNGSQPLLPQDLFSTGQPKDEIPASDAKKAGSNQGSRRNTATNIAKPKGSGESGGKSGATSTPHAPASVTGTALGGAAEEAMVADEMGSGDGIDLSPREPEKPRQKWIDLDKFCDCFQTINVYHKVHTYPHTKSMADMKNVISSGDKKDKESRKSAPSGSPASAIDERQPQYLFIDSLKPTEIIFCLSALCRWNEPPVILPPVAPSTGGNKSARDEVSFIEDDLQSIKEGAISEAPLKPQDIQPGSMISEWHFWKTVTVGQPFKRTRTTGVKAVALRLPQGRHCLKMYIRAPLGYHIQLVSSSPFTLGDEESVMPHLVKDPARLVDHSGRLIQALGKVISNFSNAQKRKEYEVEFAKLHCPYSVNCGVSIQRHYQVFKEALYTTLKTALGEKLNSDINFAWRVFNLDASTTNPLGVIYGGKGGDIAPGATTPAPPPTGGKGDSKAAPPPPPVLQQEPELKEEPEQNPFADDEQLAEKMIAANRLQKAQRGHQTRRILRAAKPESSDHKRVVDSLEKTWHILEHNCEQIGLNFFRTLFSLNPDLQKHFPFSEDELNHVTYVDYSGTHPEHPPNQWFVVFREVFNVPQISDPSPSQPAPQEVLVLPKLSTSIPTCCLRIINNDTGEELERTLGERMPPLFYKRNQAGYTFLAVARTSESSVPAGKWRLRLIGDGNCPLLTPTRSELCASFCVRDLRDYYLPNPQNLALRQVVKVVPGKDGSATDHLATIVLRLSRSDVTVRLQVVDGDEEVVGVTGRGQVVLPAVLFTADEGSDEVVSRGRAGSRASAKSASVKKKKPSPSRKSSSTSQGSESGKSHKYSIQAIIEKDSWPLSTSNWIFVEGLKQQEKEDMKLNGKPRDPSPPKQTQAEAKKETAPAKGGKGAKGKEKAGAKDKGGSKETGSRPESVTFDTNKAYWTLKVISDQANADELVVKKDTDRVDQIRAMKKAWEEVEPGRAERAKQSRLRYLNSRVLAPTPTADQEPGEPTDSSSVVGTDRPSTTPGLDLTLPSLKDDLFTLEPPESVIQQTVAKEPQLAPLDITPYLRGDPSRTVYQSHEERIERETADKCRAIEDYKKSAATWQGWLDEERILRQRFKIRQLEIANKLQAQVDGCREAYFRKRESYRVRLLEEERRRLIEIEAAQQAALAAEQAEEPAKDAKASGKKSPRASAKKSGKASPKASAKKK